jgi:beta-glucosidase
VTLDTGASQTVVLTLPAADLRFLGVDLKPVFEPGEVEILLGPCADRTKLLITSVLLEG